MMLLLLLLTAGLVAGRSDTALQSANQIKSSPFKVCIDDSDCAHMEGKYGCFQYICYPYEDDELVSLSARKTKCTRNDECGSNQVCHRHPNRRHINTGLCMDELGDCREHGDHDCKRSPGGSERRCCNGQFCCEAEYFDQLANLPCVNHEMCKDLGYGQYCCPTKESNGTTSVCCDTNPNPPPTQAPPQAGSITGAAAQTLVESAILALAAVLIAALA